MKWICDECGCELEFPSPEVEHGFIVSEMTCPGCFTVWKAYVCKSLVKKVT